MYYLSLLLHHHASGGGLPPALEVRQLGHIQPPVVYLAPTHSTTLLLPHALKVNWSHWGQWGYYRLVSLQIYVQGRAREEKRGTEGRYITTGEFLHISASQSQHADVV